MNKIVLIIFWGFLCGMRAWGQTVSPWQKEINAAEKEMKGMAESFKGELALTLRVKDSVGHIVTNAKVWVSIQRYGEKTVPITGTTNTNGLFAVKRQSTDSRILFIVDKEGYYRTEREFWFKEVARVDVDGSLEKRWMPWNPTIDVVLKEKNKPIPLYVWQSKIVRFPKGEEAGFDCKKGDLLAPYGKGEQADFTFFYTSAFNPEKTTAFSSGGLTNCMVVKAGEDGGFIVKPKDVFSELWSIYQAPESGYQPKLIYEVERANGKMVKDRRLSGGDYLIFKSRVKKNEKGEIISTNYGKIYTFGYGEGGERTPSEMGSVMVDCYFNPMPNDRNIEADPRTDLSSGQRWNFPRFAP